MIGSASTGERRSRVAARYAMVACWATLPVSIAVTQTFFYLALVFWLFTLLRERSLPRLEGPELLGAAVLALWVVAVSAGGVRPVYSLLKCRRMLYMVMPIVMTADLMGSSRRYWPGWSLLAGCLVLAVYDAVRIPLYAWQHGNWFDAGNMRDPQFYLVALCLLPVLPRPHGKRRYGLAGAGLLYALGLVLHFKRGVWFGLSGAYIVLALLVRRWQWLLALAIVIGGASLLPPVRGRIASLREEFDVRQGRRLALWTEAVPALLSEHPWGMGLCAAEHSDFAAHVEGELDPDIDHAHNNVLQIALELGWGGLAIWLLWITTAVVVGVRYARRKRDAVAMGVTAALCGLLLNGLVEYNFGTSEIKMLMAVLLGWQVMLRRYPAQQD